MRPLGKTCIVALCLIGTLGAGSASAAGGEREIHFRGQTVEVPASWPVYRLAKDPDRCVRLDRRAVYLGRPSADQRCPADAVGRARAIVVEPRRGRGVRVIRGYAPRRVASAARTGGGGRPLTRPATISYYTGFGFDACSAPSTTALAAWGVSPYRAVGVYIGGTNRACSQPNLTSTWVASVLASGWVLIPTYVGLQAPVDVCGCASINPNQATSQGTAAADDAITQAAALGIGPGNPIYYDMEGYSRTTTNSTAVLEFLEAWTVRLHSRGYVSGVYGSAASTISDLVAAYPTPYVEPDHIWIANWNGRRTTDDPYVPDSYWANHQRIHQYRGGHNETYGGVTISIDSNYLDGGVVGTASRPVLRTRLRCRRVLLKRRPRTVALRVRAFNMLHCGKARKIAGVSRRHRYGPSGNDRGYVKRRFRCKGKERGRITVVFTCRPTKFKRSRPKVSFVRKG